MKSSEHSITWNERSHKSVPPSIRMTDAERITCLHALEHWRRVILSRPYLVETPHGQEELDHVTHLLFKLGQPQGE